MIRNCDYCKNEYKTKFPSVKFCSPECKRAFYVVRNNGIDCCQVCGVEFNLEQIMRNRRFCNSKECRKHVIKIITNEKYGQGIDNPGQIPEVISKIKNTFKEKYGDERPYFAPNKIVSCIICGTPFKMGKNKFLCSDECVRTYYKNKNEGIDSCVICSNQIPLESLKNGAKTCSPECAISLKDMTCEEMYGFKNATKNPQIQAKIQATNLERYGETNVMKNQEVQAKARKTYNEHFGPNNPEAKKEMLERRHETLVNNYGENYAQVLSERSRKTYFENCENNPNKKSEIYEKRKNTFLEKHNIAFKAHEKLTNYENYNDEYIIQNFSSNGEATVDDLIRFKEYFNFSNISNAKSKFTKLGIKCNLDRVSSLPEKRVLNLLKEKYPELEIQNNVWNLIKNPKTGNSLEIDIVVKKDDVIVCGIEYNGIYYHDKQNQEREALKTQLCSEKGFKLFHIWEDTENDDLTEVLEYLNEILDK